MSCHQFPLLVYLQLPREDLSSRVRNEKQAHFHSLLSTCSEDPKVANDVGGAYGAEVSLFRSLVSSLGGDKREVIFFVQEMMLIGT